MEIPLLCFIIVSFNVESSPTYQEIAPAQLAPSLRFYYPFVTLGDTDLDIEHLGKIADEYDKKASQPSVLSAMAFAPGFSNYFLRDMRSPMPATMTNFYRATRWNIGDLIEPQYGQEAQPRFARNVRAQEKRQKYHANFDILAGGGLGR